MTSTSDTHYMLRAIELAGRGCGLASPGAMVGAVVVSGGNIVGEGFYTWDGIDHAEIQALREAATASQGSTLYVTLEPCSHHGRTPPCADEIVRAGVVRMVAAMADPNPQINGRGFDRLKQAGVDVSHGLLEAEAQRMNEAFVVSVREDRPFGILKTAMTLDGKIATGSGESKWITCPEARERGHALRHSVDAILTGSGTILRDDPALTDRSGGPRRRPLLRVIIDRRGRLGPDFRVFGGSDTILYSTCPAPGIPSSVETVTHLTDIGDIARDLRTRRDVQSLLVESGPDLAFNAISCGIIDKIVVFVAPRIFGGREIPAFGSVGIDSLADAITIDEWNFERVGSDLMITGYVHRHR